MIPLHRAAANGYDKVVLSLIEKGADVYAKLKVFLLYRKIITIHIFLGQDGRTALEFVRSKGHLKVVECLEKFIQTITEAIEASNAIILEKLLIYNNAGLETIMV